MARKIKVKACLSVLSASVASLLDFIEKNKKMKNRGQWDPISAVFSVGVLWKEMIIKELLIAQKVNLQMKKEV